MSVYAECDFNSIYCTKFHPIFDESSLRKYSTQFEPKEFFFLSVVLQITS